MREASVSALKRSVSDWNDEQKSPVVFVESADFGVAFTKVFPSVSPKDKASYERLLRDFGGGQNNRISPVEEKEGSTAKKQQ